MTIIKLRIENVLLRSNGLFFEVAHNICRALNYKLSRKKSKQWFTQQ